MKSKKYGSDYYIYIGHLIYREFEGDKLSPNEQEDLLDWFRESEDSLVLYNELKNRKHVIENLNELNAQYNTEKAIHQVFAALGINDGNKFRYRNRFRFQKAIAAAAAILIFIGGGIFLFRQSSHNAGKQEALLNSSKEITNHNKAILTLANGSKVILDSAKNGQVSKQGNATIIKQNGNLLYHKGVGDDPVVYNTLTTPKGGQFHIVLPDGSNVWLNAASSITYPTVFKGNERRIRLTGEAYFEVTHNRLRPFIVSSGSTAIKVLGTKFNVMAYSDEAQRRTTLVEGRVDVSNGISHQIIRPGQQAITSNRSPSVIIDDKADIEEALAWREGFFKFKNTDIKTIMREVSRWYDIDVEYTAPNLPDHFGGRIDRKIKIEDLIKLLEGNGIYHYRLVGRKLYVLL
ncbi:FecR family protein [Mucilaginibacter ginsenosidivorax]|uniref:DUF4974 domain-containing protein n=1 Tax=Mucilaginibacter ginsenosidivorax TaxID=862126 RepID=A0A5B8W5F8_9SPHI|nr:FecR family protein [Mucilaginibacter ginsenosidivorax]QEC78911.1 DUF4974 domain-containing protein [Mucilaginibacter ginsenosidivorax]